MFKKSNLTKIQKAKMAEKDKEENRVNERVNKEVLPLLKEICENLEEAVIIPNVLNQTIQQAMLNRQEKVLLKDLELVNLLKDGGEKTEKYKRLIELIENENLNTVFSILNGLVEDIKIKQRFYWKDKKIEELYD